MQNIQNYHKAANYYFTSIAILYMTFTSNVSLILISNPQHQYYANIIGCIIAAYLALTAVWLERNCLIKERNLYNRIKDYLLQRKTIEVHITQELLSEFVLIAGSRRNIELNMGLPFMQTYNHAFWLYILFFAVNIGHIFTGKLIMLHTGIGFTTTLVMITAYLFKSLQQRVYNDSLWYEAVSNDEFMHELNKKIDKLKPNTVVQLIKNNNV